MPHFKWEGNNCDSGPVLTFCGRVIIGPTPTPSGPCSNSKECDGPL